MKKQVVLLVLSLFTAAAFVLWTGCDSSSGDSDSDSCTPGTWTIVAPANGATDVDCDGDFVLKYCGNLDTTVDTEEVTFYDDNDGSSSCDVTAPDAGDGRTISISGGTVTISDGSGNLPCSETVYTSVTISGFSDSEGAPISSYTTTDYGFTSCDK